MKKLYQITVTTSVCRDGVGTYTSTGDAVEVEGVPYARLAHGTLVPANGWHDSLAGAQRAAAASISGIANTLL
ncbi:MAG: hypothetical protein ACR2IT_00875, partial [Pirellulales bacterium]